MILIVIGLIVGAGAVFAYFQFKSKPATQSQPNTTLPDIASQPPTAKPTPATDETANWKTHTSNFYNYTLKYPKAAQIITTLNQIGNADNKYETTTVVFGSGILKIWSSVGGRGVSAIKSEKMTIAEKVTDKYFESETEVVIKAIDSPSGQSIFFSYNLPSENLTEVDSTFDQILSTFQFTN